MTAFDKAWGVVKESRICASEGCTANIRNYEGLHYEGEDGKAYCIGCGAKMNRNLEENERQLR